MQRQSTRDAKTEARNNNNKCSENETTAETETYAEKETTGDREGPPPRAARAHSRSRSPEGRVQKLAAKLRGWSSKEGAQLSPEQLQAAQRELWEAATKLASSEDEGL